MIKHIGLLILFGIAVEATVLKSLLSGKNKPFDDKLMPNDFNSDPNDSVTILKLSIDDLPSDMNDKNMMNDFFSSFIPKVNDDFFNQLLNSDIKRSEIPFKKSQNSLEIDDISKVFNEINKKISQNFFPIIDLKPIDNVEYKSVDGKQVKSKKSKDIPKMEDISKVLDEIDKNFHDNAFHKFEMNPFDDIMFKPMNNKQSKIIIPNDSYKTPNKINDNSKVFNEVNKDTVKKPSINSEISSFVKMNDIYINEDHPTLLTRFFRKFPITFDYKSLCWIYISLGSFLVLAFSISCLAVMKKKRKMQHDGEKVFLISSEGQKLV